MNDHENALAQESAGVSVAAVRGLFETAQARGAYVVECRDADGNLRWSDRFDNLVTTAGKNDALDKYLTGSAYTATWYVGLMSATGYSTGAAAADTAASHSGWAEDQSYSETARPTASWANATAGSKALASAAVFSISANTTVKGCFLISSSTKGGATGILFSAGLFAAGDKVVQASDTLNVSYSVSL